MTLLPNTLKFFVEKNGRSFCTAAKASHIVSTKNICIFEKLTSEILTKRSLTTLLVLNNRALLVDFSVCFLHEDMAQNHYFKRVEHQVGKSTSCSLHGLFQN